jgi:hypothetical protein
MEQVEVWRGGHGDPVPLFGPLPGVSAGDVLAYEFGQARVGRARAQIQGHTRVFPDAPAWSEAARFSHD